MAKRIKEEPAAGVLEFAGRTKDDPQIVEWLADHRSRNGGKLRVSLGGTGVRVAFNKQADLDFWKERADKFSKARNA